MKSEGAEWLLAVSPAIRSDALLIGDRCALAAITLRGMFRSVEVWYETSVPIEHGHEGPARQVEFDRVGDEITADGRQWALIAFLDSLAPPGRIIWKTIEGAHKHLLPNGQCCVITGDRLGVTRLIREKLGAVRYPSARQITKAMIGAGFDSQTILRPYPDHKRTTDLVGWCGQHNSLHRGKVVRLLQAMGLSGLTYESAIVVGSKQAGEPLLQEFLGTDGYSAARDSIEQVLVRGDGTVICKYRRVNSPNGGVLKVALGKSAAKRLQVAWRSAASAVDAEPWLDRVVPNQISKGQLYGINFYIEKMCEGTTAHAFASDCNKRTVVSRNAVEFLVDLSNRTERKIAGDELSQSVIDTYLTPIGRYRPHYKVAVERLSGWVANEFRSVSLPFVLVHGDFNPGNIFCLPGNGEICGVIDWDASELSGPALLDLYSFLFGINPVLRQYRIGEKLALCLNGDAWNDEEAKYIAAYMKALQIDPKLDVTLAVIYWAKHVCTQINYVTGRLNRRWEKENLLQPLKHILDFMH